MDEARADIIHYCMAAKYNEQERIAKYEEVIDEQLNGEYEIYD